MAQKMRRRPRRRSATATRPITLLVHPDALRTIIASAEASAENETGAPLIGTVQPSWEGDGGRLIVSVLGVVPPGPALEAGRSSVAIGNGADGERAVSAIRWWRSVTGIDLRHLGDWHKHPSALREPSSGDHATAGQMRIDADTPVWLTAIAVGATGDKEGVSSEGNLVRVGRPSFHHEVRFYQADEAGLVPLGVRVEAEAIPRLPDLPWHVRDAVRFGAECRLLVASGFRIAIEPSTLEGRPSLAFRLDRTNGSAVRVVTGPFYPTEPPIVIDERGRRVGGGDGWTPARFLVDLASEVR